MPQLQKKTERKYSHLWRYGIVQERVVCYNKDNIRSFLLRQNSIEICCP